ncbi:MAG TPA: ATP-binding protein [Magnetospirillaceae bacterium]|jgi:two-component system phosphate regulon sensor histidine kinase PhoR
MAQSPTFRRAFALVIWVVVPILAIFAALAISGELRVLIAAIGAVVAIVLAMIPARRLVRDFDDATEYANRLADGAQVTPPDVGTETAAAMVSALERLRRGVKTRDATLEGLLDMHEQLFDSLPGPTFLLNAQRRITRVNRAARTLFGEKLRERDLATVLRNPPLLDAVERAMQGGPGDAVEFTLPGGPDGVFRAVIEPLPKPAVDGTLAVVALHDVTELKRVERMRADFVANASHELRTPLAALLGFIETLQGPAKDDREAHERFLGIMHEQAARMSRLVADLLTLSRIELSEHSRPQGRADLGPILKRVAEALEIHARNKRMRIQVDFPMDLPSVNGQDDELSQIFQNLVDNAIKYGRDGTDVEIKACISADPPPAYPERAARAIAVSVRDRGEGIARENLPRLTERFFRIDTARSRRLGGTGLGLAIVKHSINRHRGALVIDSTQGEGSTFTVYLPASEA